MQAQLFPHDFLIRGRRATFAGVKRRRFCRLFQRPARPVQGTGRRPAAQRGQTEPLILNKPLAELGWSEDMLPQVRTDPKRREAVPDCLLLASPPPKAAPRSPQAKDGRRYRHDLAMSAFEAARILERFPMVREQDQQAFGRYRTKDDILQFLSLLAPSP